MSLSFSSRERQAVWMLTWPGKLTDSDLTWFKELVNLYDLKAVDHLVYCMLMCDIPVVSVKDAGYKDKNGQFIYAVFLHC